MRITVVPSLHSLCCSLHMHGHFHKAESLFNLVSKVQPLECRQGEEKAVLRGTSQKPAFGSLGGKVEEWPYGTARQGGHCGPAPFPGVSWFQSYLPWCPGPAHSGLGELTSGFGLKSASMGALPPWKLANGTNQGFFPRELVGQRLPAHHCL